MNAPIQYFFQTPACKVSGVFFILAQEHKSNGWRWTLTLKSDKDTATEHLWITARNLLYPKLKSGRGFEHIYNK